MSRAKTADACARCYSLALRAHCPSPTCGWVRCAVCNAVTGLVAGEPHILPDGVK